MKNLSINTESVFVRTPAYSYRNTVTDDCLQAFLNDEQFLESIYLASADLYDELEKLSFDFTKISNDKRLKQKIAKYILRASTRSTPFGKFSSISLWKRPEIGSAGIQLGKIHRKTRLDMDVLCALRDLILSDKEVLAKLSFKINTSAYKLNDTLRYYENQLHGFRKNFNLASVQLDEHLAALYQKCAQAYVLYSELESTIIAFGFSKEETVEYLDSLISSQILVSELEPKIVGSNYLLDLFGSLQKIDPEQTLLSELRCTIKRVIALLQEADMQEGAVNVHLYKKIKDILLDAGLPIHGKKLFQVDCFRAVDRGIIATDFIKKIEDVFPLFTKLSKPIYRHKMTTFAQRFFQKYETKELPLLEVLDPELGIGYEFKESKKTEKDDPLEDFLFLKLIDAQLNRQYEVVINEADFPTIPTHKAEYPTTSTLIVKQIEDGGRAAVIESFGGVSAGNILGRFTHLDSSFSDELASIVSFEEERNPQVLFCDLSHLPDNRVANILNRDFSLPYEIPFLTNSGKSMENTIPLDDLLVSVIDDFVYLRSKKLNKYISPRILSAHNASYNTLKLYEFLVDLQTQNNNLGAYFYWGEQSHKFTFLPRVTLKDVIIFPATWKLTSADILSISSVQDLQSFQQKWSIPRFVEMKENDNELVIDLASELSFSILQAASKKAEKIIIREHLQPSNSAVSTPSVGSSATASHQFVFRVENSSSRRLPSNNRFPVNGLTTRKFALDSEWLYYKIYMPECDFDDYLIKVVKPIVNDLLDQGGIDKFFFIKYEDSETHIRLRFHFKGAQNNADIVRKITRRLNAGPQRRICIEEYERELERYGEQNIQNIEQIFFQDSLAFLKTEGILMPKELNEEILCVMDRIDAVLHDFHFSLFDKKALFDHLAEDLIFFRKKENKVNGDLIFRQIKKSIFQLFQPGSAQTPRMCPQAHALRNNNTDAAFESLIRSIIHMTVNRYLSKFSRSKEFMIYYLLKKSYDSLTKIHAYVA